MSRVRADRFTDRAGTGSPIIQNGVVVTGVATATNFSGNADTATTAQGLTGTPNIVVGIVTASSFFGNLSGNATGLSGTPDIIVGSVQGSTASFTGNVSIGGTLTYEDVTNIDSIGIVTARDGVVLDGFKVEEGKNNTSTGLTGLVNINLSEGHIHRFSSATIGNYYPNFRIDGSTTLNSKMDVGDVTTITMIVASSSHYIASPSSIQIDGSNSNITVSWIGGSAPSSANGSGYDIYSFTIMKTASTPAYHIIGNTLNAA